MKNRGFSIIELIMAISLFIVIMSIIVSVFLRVVRVQKSALYLVEANDNVVAAINTMFREIKTGTDFSVEDDSSLRFLEGSGEDAGKYIKYYIDEKGFLYKEVEGSSSNPFKITANSIKIKGFKVKVIKEDENGHKYPPRVIIWLSASPAEEALKDITINLQTVVNGFF